MDESAFIQDIRRHIDAGGHTYFPAHTPLLLEGVRAVIAATATNTAVLEALDKELAALLVPSPAQFPGSSARFL